MRGGRGTERGRGRCAPPAFVIDHRAEDGRSDVPQRSACSPSEPVGRVTSCWNPARRHPGGEGTGGQREQCGHDGPRPYRSPCRSPSVPVLFHLRSTRVAASRPASALTNRLIGPAAAPRPPRRRHRRLPTRRRLVGAPTAVRAARRSIAGEPRCPAESALAAPARRTGPRRCSASQAQRERPARGHPVAGRVRRCAGPGRRRRDGVGPGRRAPGGRASGTTRGWSAELGRERRRVDSAQPAVHHDDGRQHR